MADASEGAIFGINDGRGDHLPLTAQSAHLKCQTCGGTGKDKNGNPCTACGGKGYL